MYDVIIAGAGPAGLTAAIYARRAGLSALVIEESYSGGQIVNTRLLENYPGFPQGISGADFAIACEKQALGFGAELLRAQITGFLTGEGHAPHTVQTSAGERSATALILCMGAEPRKLGIPGEDKLTGAGISYCATCDGAFFRGAKVAVIGGGDTALDDALYLSALCEKVYIIHRRYEFRGAKRLVDRVLATPNIQPMLGAVPVAFMGKLELTGIELARGDERFSLEVEGCFLAVGNSPRTALLEGKLALDKGGYIIAGEDTRTSVAGVFAAGDIRTKLLRQVVTAAADGAVAATLAREYIMEARA